MRAFIVTALSVALGAGMAAAQVSHNAMDQQIQQSLQKEFAGHKDLAGVQASVDDQIVTLSGSVPSYRAKLEAIHEARQAGHGYIDHLTVGGVSVSDQQLKEKLATRLTYDRMGMGQTFNSLNIAVHNGVVTLSGNVRDYPDRDSAVDIAADTAGVKNVVDKIHVAPLSPMDDQIRLEAARKIYGNPSMLRYANNPAHPIRIVVNNGRVTLDGVVDSQVDKALAGNAVRSIPGVFGVQNNLVVSH
ncbi:MAG TPA: BON domain-containing protein [Terriglobales bacterium]|nr:BON domain-containing protein [Terriglobales bacterium]